MPDLSDPAILLEPWDGRGGPVLNISPMPLNPMGSQIKPPVKLGAQAVKKAKPGQAKPVPKVVEHKPAMSRVDADEWAKESVWKQDLHHGTSEIGSNVIPKVGFDLEREGTRLYGKGVYATSNSKAAESFAELGKSSTLTLRANVKNPLEVNFSRLAEKAELDKALQFSRLQSTGGGGEAGRQALMDAGFDAVRITTADFDYFIVLEPSNIVVVQ
jgi:hypothetical protein